MHRVDPRFERLARRLTSLQLRRADDADLDAPLTDDPGDRRGRAFVDTYTEAGLRTVIEHYGLHDKLVARGLGDYELRVTEEDPFHHRLELVLAGPVPDGADRHVMDMRLHLGRLSSRLDPRLDNFGPRGGDERAMTEEDDERVDVVVVEWLLMQNPRGLFSLSRPRLPGQRYPGTGLGGEVGQLLVLMCRRIHRAGLVTVPERFHLAELYARGGWRAVDAEADELIDEVKLAAPHLGFAARAWAMERGCVFDEAGAPVVYVPQERVLPVTSALERVLAPGGSWLRALLAPRRRLHVDVARLAGSLRSDPVEGMDPDALGR